MSNVERIGVSIESELLEQFDKLISEQGYQNRSEAVRDLVREKLAEKKLENPDSTVIAAVCVAYDHHSGQVNKKLMDLQHSQFFKTISSMHIHIDSQNCLEVITLKGKAGEITKMAEKIISLKGVKLGKVNLVSVEDEHSHSHNHKHSHYTDHD